MKGNKGYTDLGSIFDEVFEAAQNFHDQFGKHFNFNVHPWAFDDNVDYYPNYSYPPMNVFMTADKSLVFEFALAGFDEKDISLSFQGDYMLFSAALPAAMPAVPDGAGPSENIRYLKRRLKMRDIEKQKYYVPLDKYAQEKVKAVFRNGILRVSIPPKEEPDRNNGIKIEIVTED